MSRIMYIPDKLITKSNKESCSSDPITNSQILILYSLWLKNCPIAWRDREFSGGVFYLGGEELNPCLLSELPVILYIALTGKTFVFSNEIQYLLFDPVNSFSNAMV